MPPGSLSGTRHLDIGSEHTHEAGLFMMATLEVTGLRKQFTIGRPAIDGVSFSVPAGEIWAGVPARRLRGANALADVALRCG